MKLWHKVIYAVVILYGVLAVGIKIAAYIKIACM